MNDSIYSDAKEGTGKNQANQTLIIGHDSEMTLILGRDSITPLVIKAHTMSSDKDGSRSISQWTRWVIKSIFWLFSDLECMIGIDIVSNWHNPFIGS